ncbi:MAG: 2-oxoacid:acceptor oxidoreductase family protein [Bacillota bacterium]
MRHLWKIMAAGEGGQGVQALAETLALAAYRAERQALYIPNFGIEQRGGVSLAMVQISDREIGSPKFLTADLVAALSPRSLERCDRYIGSETIVLYDNSLMEAPAVADEVVGLQSYDTIAPDAFAERTGYREGRSAAKRPVAGKFVAVPAADQARKMLHPRVFNMIILGAITGLTRVIDLALIKEALEVKLNRRFEADPRLRDHNFRALELGYEQVREAGEAVAAAPPGGRL